MKATPTDRIRALAALAPILLAAGCAIPTLHKEAAGVDGTGNTVIVVGRIELVPPLKPGEQDLKMGTIDPLDMKSQLQGRAILWLAPTPKREERTADAFNPPLEQTYFFRIPRTTRYVVHGSVLMYHRVTAVSRRSVETTSNELLIPGPIEFDIKPSDKAMYVGTLRLHRDEFNEITRAELIDDYARALADFRLKFGADAVMRRAIARPVQTGG
ncbi:MAG: hypothetical protein ACREVP_15925 [Burkholderiales bacterium]